MSRASSIARRIGLLGDLVELDAADRHLRLEDLAQVPADRLALAVRVRREQDLGASFTAERSSRIRPPCRGR